MSNFINEVHETGNILTIDKNGEKILIIIPYGNNRNNEVLQWNKKIFNHLGICVNYLRSPFPSISHGAVLDNIINQTIGVVDYYFFMENDSIPLQKDFVDIIYDKIKDKRTLMGHSQLSGHVIKNGSKFHTYAGPGCLAFSKKLFIDLGSPSLEPNFRGDTAESLTWAAKEKGYNVCLIYPSDVFEKTWDLDNGIKFGLGNTFGNICFHAMQQGDPRSSELFIAKCKQILAIKDNNSKFSYKDIEGWFDFSKEYDEAVAEMKDGDIFVEVGSFLGKSICYLAQKVKESGKDIKIFAVDWFQGVPNDDAYKEFHVEYGENYFHAFWDNVKKCGFEDIVRPIRMKSEDAAKLFKDKSLAAIYIDANHEYSAVKNDLEYWYPKLKDDGIFFGHDHAESYAPGVVRAVNEKFGNRVIKPKKGTTWIVRPSRKLELIIASVNRAKYLDITLAENIGVFDNIIVATSTKDTDTQEICKKYNIDCHISDSFYDNGARFNRGKVFNEILDSKLKFGSWICFSDVDMVFPKQFRQSFDLEKLDNNVLYGGSRTFINTYKDWIDYKNGNKKLSDFESIVGFGVGFAQIWSYNCHKNLRYPMANDVENADIEFLKLFHPDVSTVGKLDFNLIHLGNHGQYKRESDEFLIRY